MSNPLIKEKDELVFYLREIKGKTFDEIAKIFNDNRGNMYRRWKRAKKMAKNKVNYYPQKN